MKYYLRNHKLMTILVMLIFSSFSLQACPLPYFQISNCLKSQNWETWSSDYSAVKEVCADLPIDLKVFCSSGTLSYGDEVCVYEVVGGVETLIFCDDASTFSFTPEEGKTYRIETQSGGSPNYTVSFTAVNCLDVEVNQNNGCDAIYENSPITFSIPGFNSNCYFVNWDFGDGTTYEYGTGNITHEYDLNLTDPCQQCQTFVVTISLNNEFCEEDCPPLEFEKEITVCRETYFTTGYEEEYAVQCFNDPCIVLGDYSNSPINITPCYYEGYTFEWTIQDYNWGVQTLEGLQHTLCPAVEGTYTLTMTDPWGCTFTKTLYVYNSLPPDTTVIEHILCTEDQEMYFYSPADCANIEYDPPFISLPPYSGPTIIRCYDDDGCLNKVYIHQPVYHIQEACIDDVDDICEGEDLIIDGSCSDSHWGHTWEIYELDGGVETSLWAKSYIKPWAPSIAGEINLSKESGICFLPGKCYKVKLQIAYACEGELYWNTTEKEFCVNPKPPCFGGPDVILDPCVTDCVTIGLNGYSDVIPYPYPNLTHVWEDGVQGIYRTVCPTETTTYYLTTTNEYGCVCIDEVTVTVVEHEPIENTDFPVCFSNNNEYGHGEECQMEVCIDVQINTGGACECPYSVTKLCQVIPFGETYCFDLDQLELPFDACATVIGSQYDLSGKKAVKYGSDYTQNVYFSDEGGPCDMFTQMYFIVLPDGTIVMYPTFLLGMNDAQGEPEAISNQNIDYILEEETIENRDEQVKGDGPTIYPNPAHSILKIEMPENIESIQMYSVNGELILNNDYTTEENRRLSLDISGIQNGIYIIRVQTAHKTESNQLIINH